MRIRIDLAYDGTEFKGWAKQPNLRTVQGELESAIATVLRLPEPSLVCAGRTDTGVHARGQVVHLDLDATALEANRGRSTDPATTALKRRLNGVLPPDIRISEISHAPTGFDARFSPVWRRYAYRIDDSDAPDPLLRNHMLAWPRPLDLAAMERASAALIGLHDFASFCKKRDGATTVRTLLELTWERTEPGLVVGRVRADAFCHSMVRSLVGCLLAVGDGRRDPAWAGEMLSAVRRDPAVSVVPPHGLTLEEVGYPDPQEFGARADQTRAKRSLR